MGARRSEAWRLAWPATFLAVGAAMLVLSGLGTFLSRNLVPWIFGGLWALAGLAELAWRRRKGRPRVVLLVVGVLFAVLVPLAHIGAYRTDGDLQKAFHVRTLPTTILLDDGRVVAYRIGIRGARAVLAEAERRLREG